MSGKRQTQIDQASLALFSEQLSDHLQTRSPLTIARLRDMLKRATDRLSCVFTTCLALAAIRARAADPPTKAYELFSTSASTVFAAGLSLTDSRPDYQSFTDARIGAEASCNQQDECYAYLIAPQGLSPFFFYDTYSVGNQFSERESDGRTYTVGWR